MRLRKFAKLVRKNGWLRLIRAGGSIWLGTGAAVYRATGLPESVDELTILTILDFSEKEAAGIQVTEADCELGDVYGMDLRDAARNTMTETLTMLATPRGIRANALLFGGRELIFYAENLLEPLDDLIRDHGEYIRRVVRAKADGEGYIVIYDGLEVVAALMPLEICTKEYVTALNDFAALCTEQLYKQGGTP